MSELAPTIALRKKSVTAVATLKLREEHERALDGVRTDLQVLQSFFRLAHGFLDFG